MKNSLLILMTFLSAISYSISTKAQTGNEEYEPFYYEAIKIPEKVKSMSINTYRMEDKFGEPTKGKQLQSITYEKVGFYNWTVSNLVELTKTEYKFLFEPTENAIPCSLNEINMYNKDNTLVQRNTFTVVTFKSGGNGMKESIYKDEGSLGEIRYWHFIPSDKIFSQQASFIDSYNSEGESTGKKHTYKYDASQALAEAYCDDPNFHYNLICDYEYNMQGDISFITTKSLEDDNTYKIYKRYFFEYKYDSHNNWTNKTIYEINEMNVKKVIAVAERTIVYTP